MRSAVCGALAIASVLASTSLVAAAKPADPPPAEISAADTAKLLAFMDKLLSAMSANKANCTKMAAAINKLVDKNKPMLRAVMKQVAGGKVLSKDAEAKLADKMPADPSEIMRCMSDHAVAEAMKRIENPDHKPAPAPPPPASAADLAEVKPPVAADLATYTKSIAGKGELIATIKTNIGTVRCQLFGDKAPMTVANFVGLATGKKPWLDPKTNKLQKNKPYYDGLIFHRVIPDFMIQGGDPLGRGSGGPGYTFGDETSPSDKMELGTLAMANAGPATNGSQFFITDAAPQHLNGKHTIFGTCNPVDVVKKIARVKTGAADRPQTDVKMKVTISRGTL